MENRNLSQKKKRKTEKNIERNYFHQDKYKLFKCLNTFSNIATKIFFIQYLIIFLLAYNKASFFSFNQQKSSKSYQKYVCLCINLKQVNQFHSSFLYTISCHFPKHTKKK